MKYGQVIVMMTIVHLYMENNKPNLVVDKDGTTHVKKICIDGECLDKNTLKLNKIFYNLILGQNAGSIDVDNLGKLSDAEMGVLLNNFQNSIETEEEEDTT
jgi:hypothetical protein